MAQDKVVGNWQHVYPLDDKEPHFLAWPGQAYTMAEPVCQCVPAIDWKNCVVIHNAFDGREAVEEAERIKNA